MLPVVAPTMRHGGASPLVTGVQMTPHEEMASHLCACPQHALDAPAQPVCALQHAQPGVVSCAAGSCGGEPVCLAHRIL